MKRIVVILLLGFGLMGCAHPGYQKKDMQAFCPNWTATNLIYSSKISAENSMNALKSKIKLKHSKKGLEWAEKCVTSFPQEAGCYFYRAVNRGLYFETAPIGYQKGLRQMVQDAKKVLQLNPSYEAGGAYRLLGYLYLKAPQFSLAKQAVTQDIEKAEQFAKKAFDVDPLDNENLQLQAEVMVEKGEYEKALPILKNLNGFYALPAHPTVYFSSAHLSPN